MIDLSTIPQEDKIAKGEYSIVRAAHEEQKRELATLCGQIHAITSQILRRLQPADDADINTDSIALHISTLQVLIDNVEACVNQIVYLSQQRRELKSLAWPKGGSHG